MKTLLYSKFNNRDNHIAILKASNKGVVIVDKPTTPVVTAAPITDEVFDYASDEIGAFFMNACRKNRG